MIARVRRTFAVLGFYSTHDALSAEEILQASGIVVVPIPAPRSTGALCGIALRLEPELLGRALECLSGAGIRSATQGEIQDV